MARLLHTIRKAALSVAVVAGLAACGPTAYQAYYRDCVRAGDPEHICRYQAEMMRQQAIQTNIGIIQTFKPAPPPPQRTIICTDLGGGRVSCQ